MNRNIEIRLRTGNNQYNDLALITTSIDNIINNYGSTLNDDLLIIKEIIENAKTVSSTSYIENTDNISQIDINNPNYVYLESELEVFYNGLLLIKDYHYSIVDNKINLLDFTASKNDEFVFKVYNNFKLDLDLSFLDLPNTEKEALNKLNESFNLYVTYVNKFKEKLKIALNNLDIVVHSDDSLDTYANLITKNLKDKYVLPFDLGSLIGNNYFAPHNISFDFGHLEGVENSFHYFKKDLGSII